jgi:hypothetical protein
MLLMNFLSFNMRPISLAIGKVKEISTLSAKHANGMEGIFVIEFICAPHCGGKIVNEEEGSH